MDDQDAVGNTEVTPTPEDGDSPKRRGGPPLGSKNAEKAGVRVLKKALKRLGARAIDKRTKPGKALAQWTTDNIAELGGMDQLSVRQLTILELAARTKYMLDSIDAWIVQQPSLINARKRTLIGVVRERTQLADALARYLTMLGLEKRGAAVPDLKQYLEAKRQEGQQ